MHGEHVRSLAYRSALAGPSPHARGTRAAAQGSAGRTRTIPACTGNTVHRSAVHSCRTDHPRMHGEHLTGTFAGIGAYGPSPHARGTRGKGRRRRKGRRTIPACTGNTGRETAHRDAGPDHPRMHGEHFQGVRAILRRAGPSPHARGTRLSGGVSPPPLRTIPACTGNTEVPSAPMPHFSDHPRMHGEHMPDLEGASIDLGPSPHARGTLGHRTNIGLSRWTIPACTGNTATGR